MSEHVGPGNDSGAFQDAEAKIRAHVEKLDRERSDATFAENAKNAEPPKKSKKSK